MVLLPPSGGERQRIFSRESITRGDEALASQPRSTEWSEEAIVADQQLDAIQRHRLVPAGARRTSTTMLLHACVILCQQGPVHLLGPQMNQMVTRQDNGVEGQYLS